jgi:uncharacterized membrane protein YebE (DUF533 family)
MNRLPLAALGLALATALAAPRAGAQVVENPIAFDSAGRVTEITPTIAAQLRLVPPAWRITGDYTSARLFQLADASYVIVVTRRNGVVERYPITREDREYLKARTGEVPSTVEEQLRGGLRAVGATVDRETRNAFVRNQTLLGLVVYAPSFAYAVTNDPPGRVATYLLVAGGTFFGAASLTREVNVTKPMNNLATVGALSGGLAGWGTAYALDASQDATGALVFVSSLAGTAAGLYFGQRMSEAQVTAANFGAWASALTAGGIVEAAHLRDNGLSSRAAIGTMTAAGLVGYPLGVWYTRSRTYSVTSGDVYALLATGATGAALASAFVAEENDDVLQWLTATGGWVAGLVAGDRFLVRRYDHTRSEGTLLAAGALAGGLMGAGTAVLLDRHDTNQSLLNGLISAGALAGIALTEYYQQPRPDAVRGAPRPTAAPATPTSSPPPRSSLRVRFDPTALAAAALRAPGVHTVVGVTF